MKTFKGCFYHREGTQLLTSFLETQATSMKKATDYFKSIAKERGWRFINLEL